MTKLRVAGHTLDEQEALAEEFTALVTSELTKILDQFTSMIRHQGLIASGVPSTPEDVFAQWSATSEGVLADFTQDVYNGGANAIATKVAGSSMVPLGSGVPGLPASYSASYVAKATNKMTAIAPEMWAGIQQELVIGTAAGESIDKLAARVQKAGSVSLSRAELTARTEVVGASNYGSYDQASLLGGDEGVSKVWEATEDSRTRPDHRLADGQTVPLHGTFSVGAYQMLHPGDFTAPASEVCNCRCTIVYEFDDTKAPALCSGGPDCVTTPDKAPALPAGPHAIPSPAAATAHAETTAKRKELEKVYNSTPKAALDQVFTDVEQLVNIHGEALAEAIGGSYNTYGHLASTKALFELSDADVAQVIKLYGENNSLDVGWLDDAVNKLPDVPAPVVAPVPVPAIPGASSSLLAEDKNAIYDEFGGHTPTEDPANLWGAIQYVKEDVTQADGLTDLQIAKALDDVGGTGTKYQTIVQDYLNSPEGKKAVQDLADSKVVPAPPPPVTTPTAVPGFGANGDISWLTANQTYKIKSITLTDSTITSPNKAIWQTVLHIQNTEAGQDLNALQVLRAMDEQFAAYWGKPNAHWYETKALKWAKTKAGKDYIADAKYEPKWGSYKVKKPSSFDAPGTPKPKPVKLAPGIGDGTPLGELPPLTWDLQNSTSFPEISAYDAQKLQDAETAWSSSESRDLRYYTSGSYSEINDYLRQIADERYTSSRAKSAARYIQSGMRPSTRAMRLYRGTTAKQFGLGSNATFADLQKLIGKKIQDKGFMSTSVGSDAAFSSKPVILAIDAPPGSQMAFVKSISHYGHENEMLLAAGTKYLVESVTQGARQIIVTVRIIS